MNIKECNSDVYPWRIDFDGYYEPTSEFKEWCASTFNSTGTIYKTRWYYEDQVFFYFRRRSDVFLAWLTWS